MENEHDDSNKYLNLSDDWSELVDGYGAKEKSVAGLKLLGKSVFNVGKFAFTELLPKVAEEAAKHKK